MGDKKQLLVNMIASLVNFVVSIGIGLFLTPYVVHNIGAEAYGFVGLASTFVGYAQLFTVALTSVAGRFITVAYHEGNELKANRYYSSTLAANAVMVICTYDNCNSSNPVSRQIGKYLSPPCW